mmetsp:Transcript_13088/g.25679  ORF Transcript_13088/g.25679 Transcript_13088/m.25679 type:complete len:202 (-) Transcript_13088:56-661(-)
MTRVAPWPACYTPHGSVPAPAVNLGLPAAVSPLPARTLAAMPSTAAPVHTYLLLAGRQGGEPPHELRRAHRSALSLAPNALGEPPCALPEPRDRCDMPAVHQNQAPALSILPLLHLALSKRPSPVPRTNQAVCELAVVLRSPPLALPSTALPPPCLLSLFRQVSTAFALHSPRFQSAGHVWQLLHQAVPVACLQFPQHPQL